jgi:hypothetical protein
MWRFVETSCGGVVKIVSIQNITHVCFNLDRKFCCFRITLLWNLLPDLSSRLLETLNIVLCLLAVLDLSSNATTTWNIYNISIQHPKQCLENHCNRTWLNQKKLQDSFPRQKQIQ